MDRSAYVGLVRPSTCGTAPADLWSAPEENPRPAPVSTIARTELSYDSSSSALFSGTMTSKAIEFMRSGRLSVTSATCALGRSTRTNGAGFCCSVTLSTLAGVLG